MAESKSATLERFEETGQGHEGNLIELPPECLPYPEEEDHVVAGNGSCMSCYPNCKGYRPGPNSFCSTPGCNHSFSMHH